MIPVKTFLEPTQYRSRIINSLLYSYLDSRTRIVPPTFCSNHFLGLAASAAGMTTTTLVGAAVATAIAWGY